MSAPAEGIPLLYRIPGRFLLFPVISLVIIADLLFNKGHLSFDEIRAVRDDLDFHAVSGNWRFRLIEFYHEHYSLL
jgi:hypothetical protein